MKTNIQQRTHSNKLLSIIREAIYKTIDKTKTQLFDYLRGTFPAQTSSKIILPKGQQMRFIFRWRSWWKSLKLNVVQIPAERYSLQCVKNFFCSLALVLERDYSEKSNYPTWIKFTLRCLVRPTGNNNTFLHIIMQNSTKNESSGIISSDQRRSNLSFGKFRVNWSGIVATLWRSTPWSQRMVSYSVFSAFRMDEQRGPKQALNGWCSYNMGSWQMRQTGSRIIRTTVWDISWRTMVMMFGLVTPGVTDTQGVTIAWSPGSRNFGTGGEARVWGIVFSERKGGSPL